jgi:hypothetical protein
MPDFDAISEDDVMSGTGRGWPEWFRVLAEYDREYDDVTAGERRRYLREEFGLDPWWARAVVVRYESERLS